MRLVPAAALCLAAAPCLALAAPAPQPPNTVSPLTVYPANEPPKMVASFPAAGDVIAPGVLVLKLTFDQKMLPTGFSFAAAPDGQMPACLKTPRLLNDGKTFVLLCTVGAKTSYAIALNPTPQGGFANLGEVRAQPITLAFSTNTDPGPTDLAAAMKAEKLGELDMPIQESEFAPPAPRP